ncbi:MAG: FAD:protein FMN transferase [Lachnospiraceae bacterium]
MKRILWLLLTVNLILTGCAAPESKEPISGSKLFFDTVIQIDLYGTTDQKILDGCFKLCREYENKFSRTIETSEISKINASNGTPITVSDDTIELLNKGLYYSQLSNGAFDITIDPLSILWDFKNNTGNIPDASKIQEAIAHVNYENICIEGNTVTLLDPLAKIDLGGIAKGYIADQLKKYLLDQGIDHGLINLGGNVLAVGTKPDNHPFNIGIQKPFDKKNIPITSVQISNQSVVSSGVYERYFKKDGMLYHHILNPETGFPYKNNLLEVTIISQQSVDGDGLSTTCFALGLEKGMELINQLDHTEAIFITDDYKLHYSNHLRPND